MRTLAILLTLSIFSVNAFAGLSKKTDDEVYNEAVDLIMELDFKKAEKKLRTVLKNKPEFAEAHNNLAYCLRKQGSDNYEEALTHYNRAIELNANLPEPHMYRGVLYVSMGKNDMALEDHQVLLDLGADALADELEWVITNGKEKEPEQFFGVSQKVDIAE